MIAARRQWPQPTTKTTLLNPPEFAAVLVAVRRRGRSTPFVLADVRVAALLAEAVESPFNALFERELGRGERCLLGEQLCSSAAQVECGELLARGDVCAYDHIDALHGAGNGERRSPARRPRSEFVPVPR